MTLSSQLGSFKDGKRRPSSTRELKDTSPRSHQLSEGFTWRISKKEKEKSGVFKVNRTGRFIDTQIGKDQYTVLGSKRMLSGYDRYYDRMRAGEMKVLFQDIKSEKWLNLLKREGVSTEWLTLKCTHVHNPVRT